MATSGLHLILCLFVSLFCYPSLYFFKSITLFTIVISSYMSFTEPSLLGASSLALALATSAVLACRVISLSAKIFGLKPAPSCATYDKKHQHPRHVRKKASYLHHPRALEEEN